MSKSPASLLKVYLIRHGETEWSRTGQHTGKTDIPLTENGEREAKTLRTQLHGIAFDSALSSPRMRALKTSELVELGIDIKIDADLAEWDYGSFDGLRSSEILEQHPGWNIYHEGCPGGESPSEVSERADRMIDKVRQLAGNIALFTHGHFGSVLAARWIGLSIIEAEHFTLSTASLSILSYNARHVDIPVIQLWNSKPLGGHPNPKRE